MTPTAFPESNVKAIPTSQVYASIGVQYYLNRITYRNHMVYRFDNQIYPWGLRTALRPGACGLFFRGDESLAARTIWSSSDFGTAINFRMTSLKC